MKFKFQYFKPLVISGLIVFSVFNLKSQNLSWANSFSGPSIDIGSSCAVDVNGNVYTTGTYMNVVDFDPGLGVFNLTSSGSNDMFISKLDPSGNFVWAKSIGGTGGDYAASVIVDAMANVYVTGTFIGTVDFDPGVGSFNLTAAGPNDMFVCKLDVNGNFVWAKQIGGLQNDMAKALALDGLGNLYIAGNFLGACDFDPGPGVYNLYPSGNSDIFICKLDAGGNFDWAVAIGGIGSELPNAITLDQQNNIIITGSFAGAGSDFDPGPGVGSLTPTSGGTDIFIAKYTASGAYLWARGISGTGANDIGVSLDIDNSGSVYTIGTFEGTADFDPGVGTYNLISAGLGDGFVSKLDASGNFVWARKLSGTGANYGVGIIVNPLGSVCLIGSFDGTMDLDPGTGVNSVISNGLLDIFLCKLDVAGNYLWGRTIGGTGTDFPNCLVSDGFGYLYSTGRFDNTVDFDPNAGISNLTAAFADVFNLKLCQAPDQPAVSGTLDFCFVLTASTYSVTNAFANTSFTWTIPNGWTGSSTTSSITITPTGSGGTFTVSASNSCGTSDSQTINISVHSLTVAAATTTTLLCAGESATLTASGANTYLWSNTLTGGSIIASPSVTTSYSVFGSDIYNCKDTASITIDVSECVGIHETKNEKQILNLYPNPVGNNLSIWLTGTEDTFFGSITVYNDLGVLVKEKKDVNFKNETMVVETSDLPNGIYVLKLNNNNYQNISKTFVVNR